MQKNIVVERLYTLGDYQNIKFSASVDGIPEDKMQSRDYMNALYTSLMLECDIAYKGYVNLRKQIVEAGVKDVMAFLEDSRTATNNRLSEMDTQFEIETKENL